MSIDLPGMEKDQIDIQLKDRTLSISGERSRSTGKEEESEQGAFYYSSRSFGSFYRSFELPRDAAEEGLSARYENGVLEIEVPKTAGSSQKQGQKIAIR